MATNTTNYGWTKPDYEDAADIMVINDTIDNIDAQVKTNENNISKVQAQADWNSNTGVTNLFDFDTWTQGLTAFRGTVSISENSVTVQATSNDAYTSTNTLDIPVKPNTKYILTWDSTATNEHNGNVFIFTNSITNSKKANAEEYEFTTNSGDTSFKVRFGVDFSGDSITYSNIMLRSGTITDDTYQPYAMSNAELTEEVNTAKNNILLIAGHYKYDDRQLYLQEAIATENIVEGSTWIDRKTISSYTESTNIVGGEIEQGAWLTPSFGKSDANNRCRLSNSMVVIAGNTYTITLNNPVINNARILIHYRGADKKTLSETGWKSTIPYTFTPPSNCEYITIVLSNSANTNCTPSDFGDLQINKGSTAQTYASPAWS